MLTTNRTSMVQQPADRILADATKLSESIVKALLANEQAQNSVMQFKDGVVPDQSVTAFTRFMDDNRSTAIQSTAGSTSVDVMSLSSMDTISRSQSPVAYLLGELRSISPKHCCPRSYPATDIKDMWDPYTPEQFSGYTNEVVAAVENRDVAFLRRLQKSGHDLHTASKFGESLLHIAFRKLYLDVASFLVLEAGLSLWVHNDKGVTPLHLACRSSKPAYDFVEFIMSRDPDLLYVADKRAYTPLDYTPKETWGEWVEFFRRKGGNIAAIMPRRLIFYTRVTQKKKEDLDSVAHNFEDVDMMLAEYKAMQYRHLKIQRRKKRAGKRQEVAEDDELSAPQFQQCDDFEERNEEGSDAERPGATQRPTITRDRVCSFDSSDSSVCDSFAPMERTYHQKVALHRAMLEEWQRIQKNVKQAETEAHQALEEEMEARKALERAQQRVMAKKQNWFDLNTSASILEDQWKKAASEMEVFTALMAKQQGKLEERMRQQLEGMSDEERSVNSHLNSSSQCNEELTSTVVVSQMHVQGIDCITEEYMDFEEEPGDDDNEDSGVFPNHCLCGCSFSSPGEQVVGAVRCMNHGNADFQQFVQLIIPDLPPPESSKVELSKKDHSPKRCSPKPSVSRMFKLKR